MLYYTYTEVNIYFNQMHSVKTKNLEVQKKVDLANISIRFGNSRPGPVKIEMFMILPLLTQPGIYYTQRCKQYFPVLCIYYKENEKHYVFVGAGIAQSI
jgi:hypothetical protein